MMTERFSLLRFAGFRGVHPLAKTGALPSEAFTAVLKLDNNDDD